MTNSLEVIQGSGSDVLSIETADGSLEISSGMVSSSALLIVGDSGTLEIAVGEVQNFAIVPTSVVMEVETNPVVSRVDISTTSGNQGAKGDTGATGPVGPPGVSSVAPVIFTQSLSSQLWVINHNLNTFPVVVVLDSANQEVFGDIAYVDSNTLTIAFGSAFSGVAYLL